MGGLWKGFDRKSHREIVDSDLHEISLCPLGVNKDTFATVAIPQEVKCIGGSYISTADYASAPSNAREQLALAELRMTLAAPMMRSRR